MLTPSARTPHTSALCLLLGYARQRESSLAHRVLRAARHQRTMARSADMAWRVTYRTAACCAIIIGSFRRSAGTGAEEKGAQQLPFLLTLVRFHSRSLPLVAWPRRFFESPISPHASLVYCTADGPRCGRLPFAAFEPLFQFPATGYCLPYWFTLDPAGSAAAADWTWFCCACFAHQRWRKTANISSITRCRASSALISGIPSAGLPAVDGGVSG